MKGKLIMKKLFLALAVIAVLAASFAVTGSVFAQTPNPQAPAQPGYGAGMGRGNRGGMMGGQQFARGEGILHDEMIAAFAAKLGVSAADLEKQVDAGQTVAQVAAAKGLTAEQFQTLWTEARAQALDAAVKSGKITQAQADWMKTRGGGMMAGGMGRGRGAGMNANCPYATTTTTK
jgi:hypothetical protein